VVLQARVLVLRPTLGLTPRLVAVAVRVVTPAVRGLQPLGGCTTTQCAGAHMEAVQLMLAAAQQVIGVARGTNLGVASGDNGTGGTVHRGTSGSLRVATALLA